MHCKCPDADHEALSLSNTDLDLGIETGFVKARKEKLVDSWSKTLEFPIPDDVLALLKGGAKDKEIMETLLKMYVWVPKTLKKWKLLLEFMCSLPVEKVPKIGTSGEMYHSIQLQKQLPPHDHDMSLCHGLNNNEKAEFAAFIKARDTYHFEEAVCDKIKKTLPCASCSENISKGALAVWCEKGNKVKSRETAFYHPKCFTCASCNELLVEHKSYYDEQDGTLLCRRHWNDKNKPRCHSCDESIYEADFLAAEGSKWHQKHFCCYGCDAALNGRYMSVPTSPITKQVFCEECFVKDNADKCFTCHLIVNPTEELIRMGENVFHVDCYKCGVCQVDLEGKPCAPVNGSLMCKQCYTDAKRNPDEATS